MTKSEKLKLILIYSVTGLFVTSCIYWNDPLLSLLSIGFILGFMSHETFFTERKYDEK
jgi:hypothetical protein